MVFQIVRILLSIALIVALGWLAGRLLGIAQSWLRGLIASTLGVGAATILALTVAPQNPLPYPIFFLLVILLPALLISMGISALLELVARPGPLVRVESQLLRAPHPIRAIRRWYARERRYSQITWIAASHGLAVTLNQRRASPDLRRANAPVTLGHNLREALAEAGGVFVKLGQILSTRSDLLPPEIIAELNTLQDKVPPAPWSAMQAMIEAELGAPITAAFASFDQQPIAAASIAQVYRATLPSGEQVAVKAQRPDIADLVDRDLDIMIRLARIVESGTAWGKSTNAVDLANGFAVALREELDFRVEARNMRVVSATLDSTQQVHIPKVYDQLSTSRVLVSEWLDGRSVRDAALLTQSDEQRLTLARELLDALARQIMRSGTFHADPHPGNVFVLRSGALGLLDFGSVGRIDTLEQEALRDILFAMQRRDVTELRIALVALAEPSSEGGAEDDERLERDLGRLLARHLAPGAALDMRIFVELLSLLQTYDLRFPPEVGAVFRAAVTLEGTLRVLSPGFPLMDEARTLAVRWTQESLVPASIIKSAGDEIQALLPLLRRLPRRIDRITEVAERGALTVKVRLFADARDERVIAVIASRAIMAFLGAAVGLISVLLLEAQGGPVIVQTITLFQIMGYIGMCASVALIMRVVTALLRDRLV